MNTLHTRVFAFGLLIVLFFVFIQPIRHQDQVPVPDIESVSEYMQASPVEDINTPNKQKNMVAASITAAATILTIYCLPLERPVVA